MRKRVSVVVRSKDEADRLRLTLTSLACQSQPAEIVVVNDGSSDHTKDVIAKAQSGDMDIIALHNATPSGRSASSNAGAAAASGDIVLFLDGDTLAAPDLISEHINKHRERANVIVRGATHNLRCTRPFLDPELGTPQRGQEERVERMSTSERDRAIVTREQIRNRFHEIDLRSQPGVYPGFGPRKLFELEMETLTAATYCPVSWAASSGSNMSIDRRAFLEAGGFNSEIDNNEHRELALRLCNRGLSMAGSTGRTYHLTHRSGWRDPLVESSWEDIFYAAHPTAEVALLPVFWASLSDAPDLPEAARIHSLFELAAAAQRCVGLTGRQAVREAHMRWASTGRVQ
jgi:glycosyltransferase involved in cell wall biosynthesis